MIKASVKTTVYDQVIDATSEYLGPASERFVSRIVETHLGKKPEQLTKEDIAKLHDWSTVAFALLADDAKMVDDYGRSLLAIGDE